MKLNKEQKKLLLEEFEKLNELNQENVFEIIQLKNDPSYFKNTINYKKIHLK